MKTILKIIGIRVWLYFGSVLLDSSAPPLCSSTLCPLTSCSAICIYFPHCCQYLTHNYLFHDAAPAPNWPTQSQRELDMSNRGNHTQAETADANMLADAATQSITRGCARHKGKLSPCHVSSSRGRGCEGLEQQCWKNLPSSRVPCPHVL